MGNPFLKEVVIDVLQQYPGRLSDIVFIVPGKRASLFLKKYVAELAPKPLLAPEFLSIDMFVERIAQMQKLSGLPLLFELYDTYISVCQTKPDSFESFIGWGQTLLQDFNEIDQYLIPPEKIFPYINAIKEAEHWSGADQLTEMQKKHLEFWNTLGDYYYAFTEKLTRMNKGYAGFIAKNAVEKLPEFLQKNPSKIYIFTGFNALSNAEQRIIQFFLNEGNSDIYWDIDRFFVQSPEHDAGLFIRRYLKNWRYYQNRKPKWLHGYFLSDKEIQIIGTPKSVNQAHLVGDLVEHTSPDTLEKTALVLADERFLIPVLQSLQSSVPLNITMGYPLQQTPMNDLFVAYFRVHLSKSYYYKDVQNILTQPFLQILFDDDTVTEITSYILTHNLNYLTGARIVEATPEKNRDLMQLLFPEKTEITVMQLIENALQLIYRIKQKSDEKKDVLMLEYAYRFYQLFNQLKQLQNTYGFIDTTKTLYHFYLDVLQKDNLDFMGEPLEGLQLMGVLESRNLDFENLIITSVNEGVLPSGRSGNSFIPHDVKAHLGLPTFKERDAIYSYHFYRMLQRAKNITLVYDTETDGLKGKEKSRFILQLLAQQIPTHHITHQIKAPQAYPALQSQLSVTKDDAVIERLKTLALKGFSPSALTTYIRNPIDFYQQYVLQVWEEREVEETIELRTFGDIVHNTLEDLYRPYLNQILLPSDFDEMKKRVTQHITEHFKEQYRETDFKQGKNALVFNVIQEYICRFLTIEKNTVVDGNEIVVLDLERKLNIPFRSDIFDFPIHLKGFVDRIDKRNGELCIIDYKTGKVALNDVGLSDWNLLNSDFKYSKAFQLLAYAYMYRETFGLEGNIQAGNISFKNLKQGFIPFYVKEEEGKDETINDAILENFHMAVETLLTEIFDKEKPFEEKPL